jgi:predicted nucleic acid-binding protein
MNSVLVDTSFCIRLVKADDPFHQNAIDYFEYFLENKIEIYLSTIAIAEYSVKDAITNLPLKTMKIVPFDFFDGIVAGEFYSVLLNRRQEMQAIERNVIKDDCKLLAQLYNRKIDAYITKDKRSFGQIIEPIIKEKKFQLELIDMSRSLKEFKGELF